MAVERMETCDDVGALARELGVWPRCLYKWRKKLESIEPGQEASRPSTHASAHRKEIHRLKQLLAEKTLELDFFKGALQRVEARRQNAAKLARRHLGPDPRSNIFARQPEYRAHVPAGFGQSQKFLPIVERTAAN
jgi:transposase